MLGNCDEKMVLISSSNTNQWPQNQRLDEKNNMMASTSRLLMEKQPPVFHEQNQQQQQQQHQQQQQPPLKCPRCDSSNTKFCYYNNYSLSQPRHFCKACKRYWTRGGTLRNVPVGGGCRKNKRVKRHSSSSTSSSANIDGAASNSSSNPATPTTTTAANPNPNPNSTTTQHPLFYGLSTNPSDLNLPFSRFSSCGYDLQPQLNALGLGFSSGFMSGDGNYQNGFNPNKQIQDVVSSSSLLSNFPNPTSSPTMASLLASSFHQQKFINNSGILRSTTTTTQAPNDNHFNSLTSFEDRMQMAANGTNTDGTIGMKEMKAEEAQNRMDWNIAGCQNQMEQIGLSDPNSLYWNSTSVGGWHDPTNNIGSSVTSLI